MTAPARFSSCCSSAMIPITGPLTPPGSSPSPTIFFFNVTATTEIYTLSLHDALPIAVHQREFNASVLRALDELSEWTAEDRKSTRLNSSHITNSYAVFGLKKKTVNLGGRCPLLSCRRCWRSLQRASGQLRAG